MLNPSCARPWGSWHRPALPRTRRTYGGKREENMEETEVVRGRAHETQASCGGDRSTYASGSSCLLTQGACMPDSVDLGANEWRRLPYRSAGGAGAQVGSTPSWRRRDRSCAVCHRGSDKLLAFRSAAVAWSSLLGGTAFSSLVLRDQQLYVHKKL
jgi:hypothetical protein